jgi:ABC-type amino acid transport substrate-binding protein
MGNTLLRKNIFEWINRTLVKLSSDGADEKPFNDLKTIIQKSIRELIAINDGECVALLDKWFEDSYQE